MKKIKSNPKTKRFQKSMQVASLIVLFMLVALTKTNAITRTVNSGGSIQTAINASSNGDTIIVNAGTYGENLTINKQLTLLGANAAVSPNGGTRVAESIIDLGNLTSRQIRFNSNNIIMKGFRIINLNQQGAIVSGGGITSTTASSNVIIEKNLFENLKGNAIYTSGTISNWTISDNKIQTVTTYTGNFGSGLSFWVNATNLTITNNTFSNLSWEGIQLVCYGTSSNNFNIQNNTFTNIARAGINIASNLNNVQIQNNTITSANTLSSATDGGMKIQSLGAVTSTVISNNTVTGSFNGIYVRNDFSLVGKDIVVTNNDLSNNSNFSIRNQATGGTLTATSNWYGTTNNVCSKISGSVTYMPFQITSNVSGTGTGYSPIHNTTQNTYFCTIQAAVNDANANDVIVVPAGTYTGNVTVNKSVKIYGNNYNINPNNGSWNFNSSRNAESIINNTSGTGFRLAADNIEIKGFKFTSIAGGGIAIGNTSLTTMYSNWTIENNWFAENTDGYFVFTNGPGTTMLVENVDIKNNRIENSTSLSIADRTPIIAWRCGTLSITGNYIADAPYHAINADGYGNGTISNNYIKDARYAGIQLPTSSSSTQYFVVENNIITGCQMGIYSYTRESYPYIKFLIRNNTILVNAAKLDLNFGAIVLQGTNNNLSTPNIVEGNTITISGTVGTSPFGKFTGGPATATYGIVLSGSMGITRVNNNLITAIGVTGSPSSTSTNIGPDMSGIYFKNQNTSSNPSATELSGTFQIQSNIVEGFKNSVISFNTSTNALSSLPSGANATITENKLLPSTSGYAILAATGGNLISATCNWYGSTGYADVASKVAGNVTFVSFLVSGTDNDLATSGFQPATGTCTGESVSTPTVGSSAAVFTSISQTAITFTFTKGNGANRIIVAKSGSVSSTNPTNNTSYTANAAYGSGDALDGFVVYNGDGESATITNLTAGTLYHFSIYEYNSSGATILYSTSTKYSTCTTTSQPDADGDGVADADDEYPNDVNKAFNNLYPSASYATLMFEDLWPGKGDYDFNDLVLNYQYNTVTNASNQVVEVRYNFVTRAVGGSLHNGFAFQLDSINPNKITSVTGSKAVGASWLQLNSNGTEASQGDNANIVVFDDAYKLLPTQAGFSFINTYQGSPDSGKDTTSIVVKFIDNGVVPTGGAINYSSFGTNLFNPYIILNQVRGKEVHLVDRVPSSKVDASFFGTAQDKSNPGNGSYYKTANNLPWAISVSSSIPYPQERTDISEAFSKFIPWASSNGTSNQTWYLDTDGNRDASKLIIR